MSCNNPFMALVALSTSSFPVYAAGSRTDELRWDVIGKRGPRCAQFLAKIVFQLFTTRVRYYYGRIAPLSLHKKRSTARH